MPNTSKAGPGGGGRAPRVAEYEPREQRAGRAVLDEAAEPVGSDTRDGLPYHAVVIGPQAQPRLHRRRYAPLDDVSVSRGELEGVNARAPRRGARWGGARVAGHEDAAAEWRAPRRRLRRIADVRRRAQPLHAVDHHLVDDDVHGRTRCVRGVTEAGGGGGPPPR